ncbi:MAG: glutaredoxin 3 [Legionellales bacterium]|jgi:glutaredoxin 3|nr:glutaredoxin 3 [Legionellales bacterium]
MTDMIIYSKNNCPYCDRAKDLLKRKNIEFKEVMVDLDQNEYQIMLEKSKRRTVPQIFFKDKHIGGFDDLWALEQAGELNKLILNG